MNQAMRIGMFLAWPVALAAAGSWLNGVEKGRADYETGLKSPSGWLSVTGLFWLHEGAKTVGSDSQSDVVTPPGTPTHSGYSGSIRPWLPSSLQAGQRPC